VQTAHNVRRGISGRLFVQNATAVPIVELLDKVAIIREIPDIHRVICVPFGLNKRKSLG
jgi:hypothetical protein